MRGARGTRSSPLCHGVQRLCEICQQVLRVLTASAEPDKTLWNGISTPAGAPFRGRVQSPKAGGFVDQLTGGEKRLGLLTSAEHKADHWPKALHLACGDGMRRVVGQTGIAYRVHIWSAGEQRRQRQRVVALARLV